MIDLAYILRRAWRVWRRHKKLWPLGFVANLGIAGARLDFANRGVWERAARELPPDLARPVLRLLEVPYLIALLVVLGVILVLAGIGLTLLSTVARVALISQVQAAEERGAITLGAGWREAKRHLWPAFLLRLLLGLPTVLATIAGLALTLLWTVPSLTGRAWPGGGWGPQLTAQLVALFCLVPTIGFLLLVSVPLGVMRRLALRAYLLEGHSVHNSIRRAAETARGHWGATLLLWLVQFGLTTGAVVLFGLPLVVGAWVLSVAALGVGLVSLLWSIVLTFFVGVLVWLAGTAMSGVVKVFVSAMWTLAYREMHGLGLTGE
jgi:hypothetical protein